MLLKHNASVNNIGMKTMTALLVATKGGYAGTALRLLENRTIDIKIQDKVEFESMFRSKRKRFIPGWTNRLESCVC